jgi:hypothetical protein
MTELVIDSEAEVSIIGEVKETDDGFDHEFGYQQVTGHVVKNFKVEVYIDGEHYNITAGFCDKDIERFKDQLVTEYITQGD